LVQPSFSSSICKINVFHLFICTRSIHLISEYTLDILLYKYILFYFMHLIQPISLDIYINV
jgi:hypothetical protein